MSQLGRENLLMPLVPLTKKQPMGNILFYTPVYLKVLGPRDQLTVCATNAQNDEKWVNFFQPTSLLKIAFSSSVEPLHMPGTMKGGENMRCIRQVDRKTKNLMSSGTSYR